MVVEREPPKADLAPSAPPESSNQVPQKATEPAFGKPSTLHSPLRPSVFNVPKQNQPRPEHHRPIAPNNQIRASSDPFRNPFGPKPVLKPTSRSSDVVEIPKPANVPTNSSYPAPPVMYSSLDTGGGFTAVNQFDGYRKGNLVDLTDDALFGDKFGAPDPYEYIDTEKANRDIKSLLEGAFEDEDDKPRTRGRKKKLRDKANDLADKVKRLSTTSEGTKHDHEDEEDEDEDDGTLEGLKVKLLPHQVDGVEWMKEKEMGAKKIKGSLPKGGILADDMGLGKTIQTISLILSNPRPSLSTTDLSKDAKSRLSANVGKGTLVVAPLALIKQWEAEIKSKVEDSHSLRVLVHHGPQRTRRYEDLRKYDVVITTYQTLTSEHGNSSDQPDGPKVGCFGGHWYRIVLDEAHTIKNRNAKSTQACYSLNAEYRWCLTGTPMQNNLDELQSLIRFLRIKPYNELKLWKDAIIRPLNNGRGGIAMRRLQVVLKAFMKRRTKDILKAEGALNPGGKPSAPGASNNGFKITDRKVNKVVAEFSPAERLYYSKLEAKTGASLDKMMGDSKMSYASALTLLLRLRQACNHKELVKKSLSKDNDALATVQLSGTQSPRKQKTVDKDIDAMADMLEGLSVKSKQCDVCLTGLSKTEIESGMIRCSDCEADLADEDNDEKKARNRHRKSKKHKESKDSSQGKSEEPPAKGKTRRIIEDSDEEGEGEGEWIVPEDQQSRYKLGKAGGTDDENAEGGGEWIASDDSDTDEEGSVHVVSQRKKVVSLETTDDDGESSSGHDLESEDEREDSETDSDQSSDDGQKTKRLVASTKIRRLVEILRKESSFHKFIVFSQFTSMLDLIEPFLQREGFVFTRYDGKMRNDLREASLEKLRNDKRTRILLCSLKCGSLGLNLTAASRVILLEPFWNPFVEEQAIDRVHRLNQTLDVIVYKLTITDSVEERIFDLQEKKRALAEAAIEGKAIAKLSMQDILNLFRRDAEYDPRHEEGHGELGTKTRVLHRRNEEPQAEASGEPSRRSTPPVMERGKVGNKGKEDALYGRRW